PLSPTRDAMGRRSWFVPMEPLADALEGVSSTGWTVFCHDFWQDYPFAEGDDTSSSAHAGAMTRPRNRGEHPRNPAVSLIVYPDFEGDKQRYGKLGTLTTRDESSYEGYTFGLADVRKVSILDVRKDPGVPLLYAGFAGLTLAMMVVLYLMPRTVRLHARRERGTTHAVVGGTGRTGAFEREFAAIAEAVDAEATK
ncbi:MAG: cytochrome c biogenesis protein ResB, partial [Armatimonadota bacterium]